MLGQNKLGKAAALPCQLHTMIYMFLIFSFKFSVGRLKIEDLKIKNSK
jgi:hypothetical protein